MNYTLLTGATGLLGGYLIRDLLLDGIPLALLVRPTRTKSATERIEEVVKHWRSEGFDLPMPQILVGDISQPCLGLSEEDQRWASKNCSAVIHSAASLKFQPVGGEPWNSNLGGTRHVIELCEKLGIPQLHYVSTAYVCGKTPSTAYEMPASGEAEPRNVYEASKRQAEQLVLDSQLAEPPTILRPSIIIGDSQTGYTTTFHGPYLPLRLALSVLDPRGKTNSAAQALLDPIRILKMMGLTGSENKNVVPVDWVSRNIAGVVKDTSLHGQIYHLTTERSMSVETLTRTTVQFVVELLGMDTETEFVGNPQMDSFFTSQMAVYRDYWANDPDFDATNRCLAFPNDPAPLIDEALLRTTFRYVADCEMNRGQLA